MFLPIPFPRCPRPVSSACSATLSTLSLLLGPGILATNGPQHRRQRKLLVSAFSQAHIRDMLHTVYNVAHQVGICMPFTRDVLGCNRHCSLVSAPGRHDGTRQSEGSRTRH